MRLEQQLLGTLRQGQPKLIFVMQPDGTLAEYKVLPDLFGKPEWVSKLESRRQQAKETKDRYRKTARKMIRDAYARKDLRKKLAKVGEIFDEINGIRETEGLPVAIELEYRDVVERAEVLTIEGKKEAQVEAKEKKMLLKAINEAVILCEEDVAEEFLIGL